MSNKIKGVAIIFKRNLTGIIAIILMISLSACRAQQQPISASESPAESSAPIETAQTADTSAESSAAETDSGTGLARGTWSDDVYSNEFAQLRLTLPEGWVVATDEEIASITGQAADMFSDKQKWMVESAKLTTIYDTLVQDPITGNNMFILFENLSLSIGGTKFSEEDYFEAVKQQLEEVETLSYTFGEPYRTTFNGVDFLVAGTAETSRNLSQYYLLHKQDKYMVCLIVSIVDGTKIEDILAQFK